MKYYGSLIAWSVTMIALVTQAVKDGYDGIAVDIIHATDFDKPIKDAIAAGVPVVAFNTDAVTPNPRLSTVSQNLYQAGQTVATRAFDFIPSGSEVLVTMHDAGVSALEERRRGIQDVLKQKGIRWTVVVTTPQLPLPPSIADVHDDGLSSEQFCRAVQEGSDTKPRRK